MELSISNVRATLEPQGLNPSDSAHVNTISEKLLVTFPNLQSWHYDEPIDCIQVQFRVVVPVSVNEIGEVLSDDVIVG